MALTEEQVNNATGDALDEMVALAHGWRKGARAVLDDDVVWFDGRKWRENYRPTTNGSQCNDIQEREKIGVYFDDKQNCWIGSIVIFSQDSGTRIIKSIGKTAMIAICRCFVLSKLEVINGNK